MPVAEMKYRHAARCGERIRELREQRRDGLKEVAAKAGLSFQYLSRVEKGEVNTPIETLARIAEALNVSLEALICGEERQPLTLGDTLRVLAEKFDAYSR